MKTKMKTGRGSEGRDGAQDRQMRETEMGNEKDRAVIIIAEFAFRMQTDQGQGACSRDQIPHKHARKLIHTHLNLHTVHQPLCFKRKKRTMNVIKSVFLCESPLLISPHVQG